MPPASAFRSGRHFCFRIPCYLLGGQRREILDAFRGLASAVGIRTKTAV